ncbi:hypothetical protein [Haloferax chudinovii]|uniref:Uncharacterized protein n=1 Tax=Haloferax chudinovii TaxID=1109010 RepID=A0ABD5XL27_9EURY
MGGEISGDGVENKSWNQETNVMDYNIVFLNLDDIVQNSSRYTSPDSDGIPERIEFPQQDAVIQLIESGNEMFVFLPQTRTQELKQISQGENHGGIPVDLISWLPFEIGTSEKVGKSVKSDEVDEDWQWYFNDHFDWPMVFDYISLKKSIRESRPLGYMAHDFSIASTVSDEVIATSVSTSKAFQALGGALAKNRSMVNESQSSGSVYLLPIVPEFGYDRAVRGILSQRYGVKLSSEDPSPPEWLDEWELPRQRELREQYHEVKNELEQIREDYKSWNRYKHLLDGTGDALEEAVIDAFRELGFETKPEDAGERDGLVSVNNCIFAIETFGTNKKAGLKKVQQLITWVEDTKREYPESDVSGLLVVNPYRQTPVEEREERAIVADNAYERLEKMGFKAVTSSQLYEYLSQYQQSELDTGDIASLLLDDDGVVL